ncbi:MAG: molybdopterin synthase sulfur carrier subunit [Acidimicrobiia bacterium]
MRAMAVTVLLPTLLRAHADGASSVSADGATVGEVFRTLIERYPGLAGNLVAEDGALHKFVNVYRNDDDIRYLDQLDTPVTDGDEISILPAVAGGTG